MIQRLTDIADMGMLPGQDVHNNGYLEDAYHSFLRVQLAEVMGTPVHLESEQELPSVRDVHGSLNHDNHDWDEGLARDKGDKDKNKQDDLVEGTITGTAPQKSKKRRKKNVEEADPTTTVNQQTDFGTTNPTQKDLL